MSKRISWPRYWTSSAFSWPALSWPESLNTAESQSGWWQVWNEAWSETWREARTRPRRISRRDDGSTLRDSPDAAFDLADLSARSVIVLVGLAFEARIAAGPGVLVICRGGESPAAETLPAAIHGGCRSIISFGVAGGLAPDLVPGDCIVASAVVDYPALRPTDPLWSGKLLEMIPDACHGPILGVNAVVSDPRDKRRLAELSGAIAVDMESHLVARLAAAHGLSFASVRVVIDPADRMVPPAALLAMAPDGAADVSAMLWEILARPSQLAALMRIAADAYAARAALVRLRRVLGPDFRCG
jgi:adenosylhomocysteine nucleosidase